jgi:uncharacterized protein (UPF0262 family)
VRIDDRTWKTAEAARREEWLLSIHEILASPALSFPAEAVRLRVELGDQHTTLTLEDAESRTVGQASVAKAALTEHVREYIDIVRQMDRVGEGLGSVRLEALDMAKKLAHDDAARTLRRLLKPLHANHETCRLLWTLLLTLRIDTTRLTGVRGHRPVR